MDRKKAQRLAMQKLQKKHSTKKPLDWSDKMAYPIWLATLVASLSVVAFIYWKGF